MWTLLLVACKKPPEAETPDPEDTDQVAGPRTCLAPDRPSDDAQVELVRAHPDLDFVQPVFAIQVPGDTSHWFVGEQKGRVYRFENDAGVSDREVVLDLRERVSSGYELGLLGMAFHPEFASNGLAILSYTDDAGDSQYIRVTSPDGGETFDLPAEGDEDVILTIAQPYENHNGGHVAFGPDGRLYLGPGDGGSAEDPHENGQSVDTLLGKILRIDIDAGAPYAIPPDNPFAAGGGEPEIYAWGLRNPWRFSFDRATGELWAGDVGQYDWEEIDRIVLGGNYGWNTMEGTHCFDPPAGCDTTGLIDPVAEYGHDKGYSVTGGYVYRGSAIPEIEGVYLFADYGSGVVWGLFDDHDGGYDMRRLAKSGLLVSSFAEDADGELYLLDHGGTGLWRFMPATSDGDEVAFPQKLSETGCFSPDDPTEPVPELIPYEVRSALWSDGLDKARWMSIPEGATIDVGGDGDWDLPVGTVLIKEFSHEGTRIETRLLVHHEDGDWAGYAYVWDGEDATLAPGGVAVELGSQVWNVPGEVQCLQCHTSAAGRSLGLETAQLGMDQVEAFVERGLFSSEPPESVELPEPSDGDEPVDARARSYLHANCSHCHRPNGPAGAHMDLRYDTPLSETGICDALPEHGDLGVEDARIVAPGNPGRSVLALRMGRRDALGMPPLGTAVVDTAATSLVEAWIAALDDCTD